jgi:hypothetical protein
VQAHELPFTLCVVVDINNTRLCEQYFVDDKASGVSARHFHIVSRNSDNNNNYGDDDNECR